MFNLKNFASFFLLSFIILLLPNDCLSAALTDLRPSSDLQQLPRDATGCEAGYANHSATNLCYELGSTGPCKQSMIFVQSEENSNFGTCECKYNAKKGCLAKPVVVYEDKCHSLFEQGPCENGQWLIKGTDNTPKCEQTSCTITKSSSQVDEKYEETRRLLNLPTIKQSESTIETPHSTAFTFSQNGKCYRTFEQAFCSGENEIAVFVGGSLEPSCINNVKQPIDCYSSDIGINAP